MKNLSIAILCLIALQAGALNRPENIPSRLREVKASNWYLEKFRSWTSYLANHPQDRSGWLECFKAAHYSGMSAPEVALIADQIAENFPESPEAYWTRARLNRWTPEGVRNLEKALANMKKDVWITDRIMLAELKGTARQDFLRTLHESALIYPSLLQYSYNVLMSVGENGFLFTEGENTTIPLWILQDVMDIRKDVRILSMDLLEHPGYRAGKLEELDLKIGNGDLSTLPLANPGRDFYFALTLPRQNIEMLEDRLYVVGLTSLLSSKEINNYELLKKNIEEKFLLDYLTVDFNGEPKTATGRTFEPNYIVPFYVLKQYYDQTNMERSVYWEKAIKAIAGRSQLGARVDLLLSRSSSPREFAVVDIEVKRLDKELTKVKDNIYAKTVEVTNKEYAFFLSYLKDGYTGFYETAKFDFTGYDAINKAFSESYHFNSESKHMNYSDYPVMDITHDAAKLYCEWLTTQYNGQNGRTFKKVKFRLPSRQEWTMAALGYVDFQSWVFEDNVVKARPYGNEKPRYFEEFRIGDYDSVSYPWYHNHWEHSRKSITNEHGCYLANVRVPEDQKTCMDGKFGDGFRITSPAATYFSNDMGLFDVIGNVAEMIDEPGIAMGGSWNHPPEESTITSAYAYDSHNMSVGFRIFMEVIEE